MSKLLHAQAVLCALLCSTLTTQIATADDNISMDEITKYVTLTDHAVHDAKETQAPVIDPYRLSDEIQEKISGLVQRKEELVQIRKDNKMSVGDYIFAVIMPGGMLYAGYKKREYYLAKKDLVKVNTEIDKYVSDLDAMQATTGSIVLAPQHLVDVNQADYRF